MTHLYLIAGEASGDLLGSRFMSAVRRCEPNAVFSGIGGATMTQAGLASLFPMKELSLLGFLEIIPHIPKLLSRIRQTVNDIIDKQPDIVVTIDAPAFTRRVIQQLRKRTGRQFTCVHYVAPSVWAYKPGRAKKVAALYDHLLCLLPFEPDYFEHEGLSATYIGHSVVEENIAPEPGAFRKQHNIGAGTPLIGMTPGSRTSEIKRHLPILRSVAEKLVGTLPGAELVIPSTDRFAQQIEHATSAWSLPCHVVTQEKKWNAMAACNVALVKSGTVSLEWARLSVPSIVFYRVNPLSAWLLRQLIQVEHVNLINLLEKQSILPEYLQEACTSENLAQAVYDLYHDTSAQDAQRAAMELALETLGQNRTETPSDLAARTVLSLTG